MEQKPKEEIEEQRRRAFEQKYIAKLTQDYQQTLNTFSKELRYKKEQDVADAFQVLSTRLVDKMNIDRDNIDIEAKDKFEFADIQKIILKLKIARYFQNNEQIDVNTLFDAIIESPKFINTDRGSLRRLLEVHEEKTLQKIAEIRKQRAEMEGKEAYNPYENLFQTTSGEYYVARLLNMPHLQEESAYMNHCVGTSDSYVNKIKRGDVEILSFRRTPRINSQTQKLEGDTPLITIEYNPKTKTIKQIRKNRDRYLDPADQFYPEVIDALKQLRLSQSDNGALRDFKKIANSELQNIPVKDYYILTENGEVAFNDFNPDTGIFVIKIGNMEIHQETSKEDAVKILRIVGDIKCTPEEFAYGLDEVNEKTKVYIGKWNPEIAEKLPASIIHLYESFPEKKILRQEVELTTKSAKEYKEKILAEGYQISPYSEDILNKMEALKLNEVVNLVSFSVEQLGFPNGATLQQIYDKAKDLGLELCPPQVGPELRLTYKDQPLNEWLLVAMEPITDRYGYLEIFSVGCDDGLCLNRSLVDLDNSWNGYYRFVFLSYKN